MQQIYDIMAMFGITPTPENITVLAVLAICLGLSLLLKATVALAYYKDIAVMVLFMKPVTKKSDIKPTASTLINRCLSDYAACGDAGAPLSQIETIVMKNLARMGVIGINFMSVERLSLYLNIIAGATAITASIVFSQIIWVLTFAILYGAICIICLFLDTNELRDRLFYGLSTYINKELARFYVQDDKAGLRIFKTEIHETLMEQASILQNAINNLRETVSDSISKSYDTQQAMFADINNTMAAFKVGYDALKSINEELSAVLGAKNAVITALNAHEQSTKAMTSGFADALSKITEYSANEAADKLNEAITGNMAQFQTDTSRVIEKLTELFETQYTQTKSEIKSLRGLS